MFAPQFSLRTLLVMLSSACVIAAMANWLGIDALSLELIFGLAIATLLIAWVVAYERAPEATKHVTVAMVLGTLAFSLLPCYVLHAREEARRNSYRHHMRQSGQEYLERHTRQQPKLNGTF